MFRNGKFGKREKISVENLKLLLTTFIYNAAGTLSGNINAERSPCVLADKRLLPPLPNIIILATRLENDTNRSGDTPRVKNIL